MASSVHIWIFDVHVLCYLRYGWMKYVVCQHRGIVELVLGQLKRGTITKLLQFCIMQNETQTGHLRSSAFNCIAQGQHQ